MTKLAVILLCLGLVLLSPLIVRTVFFQMPEYSSDFDCDDAALLMMDKLQGVGLKATPMLGNLNKPGAAYLESDHVWVLVDIAGRRVALDRGAICLDPQHYRGFLIDRQQLLQFVAQDLSGNGQMIGNPGNR